MKKLSIFLMSAIALAFTSCDDYTFESPAPQSNPQEEMLLIESVNSAVSPGGDMKSGALDLNTFKDKEINVINIGKIEKLPEGQNFDVVMQIALTEDFAKAENLNVKLNDGVGSVLANDWAAAHLKFSKSPKAKTTYYRFIVSMIKGAQKVRIGDASTFFCAGKTDVTPYPSNLVIEEAYYLLGTINEWSVAKAVKFDHTGDVYDNPTFTIKVDISPEQAKNGWWWKIVPQSTFATGNWVDAANSAYGVVENGSEEMSGMLFARPSATEDCGAGCIKQAGQWLITINLEEGTYAFTSAVDRLYTPGDANGWNQGASQVLRTSDYANYSGYAILSPNGFKFSSAPDWDHTNYGLTAEEGKLSVDPQAGNLVVPTKGLYYCNVNTAALTYSTAQVTTYGLIGDATPGGWDASTALTPSADLLTWTATVKFIAGKEYKFRANNDWGINLGGSLTNLTQDGANMASPGDGEYVVTLNLASTPYTATLVKK